MVKRILMAIIFVLMCISYAYAGTATLSWDIVTGPDQVGIKVFMSTAPDVAMSEANKIADLPIDTVVYVQNNLSDGTYFFVVASYDANGDLTGPSNECSKKITSPPTGLQCN